MVVLIGLAATLATLLGGAFAIKNRDKLHLILGFSAGAVIAVAFFDLLPEALELGSPYFDGEILFMFVAIGFLAFQVSVAVGAIVTVAVLAHDFSDGINTVNMILKNKGEGNSAFRWLIVDAVAPVLGVISTLFFTVPESGLAVILAIFSGFFLYIGASDLVPESHHAHPKLLTTAMTIVGAVVLFTAVKLAGV